MAKVTVNTEKAADQPDAGAPVQVEGARITDSRGRVLVLRELDVLDETRLIRALGAEDSVNSVYVRGYVMPAAQVASIDGDDCLMPNSQKSIEAAIKRVDRAGISAVLSFLYPKDDAAKGEEAALKNS